MKKSDNPSFMKVYKKIIACTSVACLLILFQPTLLAQPLPACDPADGNMVTMNCSRIIVRNLNAACNTTVPNLLAGPDSDCDTITPGIQPRYTATPGPGWIFNGPLIQVPAAGTLIDLGNETTCPTQTIQITIIGVFSTDNGTPLDPTDDEICQIQVIDGFNIQDVTPPTLSLPAVVNLFADANCEVTIADVIATFNAGHVADNCTDDAVLLANIMAIGGMIAVPSVTCPGPFNDYLITFQTQDACGNLSNSDVVTVRVRDNTAPTVTCPADVTLHVNASCVAVIPRDPPAAYMDNCDPGPGTYSWRIIASSHPAVPVGVIPPAGRSVTLTGVCGPVTATVRICAQDCFGNGPLNGGNNNVTPNCCTYTYTLLDTISPNVSAGCGVNTNLTVNGTCTAIMPNLAGLLTVTNNCGGPLAIFQIPQPGSVLNDGIPDPLGLALGMATLPAACALPDQADPIVSCGPAGIDLKTVNVSFVLVDCSGNCRVVNNCRTLTLQDLTAPNAITCPAVTPIFNLMVDTVTCQYTTVTVPADFFNGLAVATDNCDPDPIERNNAATFNCSQLGIQNIPVWAEDCNGNISGILTNCPVLIQANPADAGWTNPGTVCMSDPFPLDLCAYITGVTCGEWSGDGVTTGDCASGGGQFTPTGPGAYAVTYTVGDANCHVELTRVINVDQSFSPPFLIDDFGVCLCPDALIDLESYLLGSAPEGGEWMISSTGNLQVVLLPPPGPGNSHLVRYDEGCGDMTATYTYTDCSGTPQTDNIVVTIRRCPIVSFDMPSGLCQDENSFNIDDSVRTLVGCDDYIVTFDVISGPSGDLLIGGAPVSGPLAGFPVVVVNPLVEQGTYLVRATIVDPTGICPAVEHEEVIIIHRDGASPNSINDPGVLCETDVFPLTLTIQDINDEFGLPLPPGDVRWFGTGVTDVGTTASFQPGDADGDGLPGPGIFTVCVDLGDPRCTDRYCRDITIENAVIGNCIINNQTLCLTPNQVLSYDVFLSPGAPLGGTWSVVVTPTPDLTGIPNFNGYIYNGGCGTLTITYIVAGQCGDPITCTGTITIQERPDVDIVGDFNLCVSDPAVIIRNNGRTSSFCGSPGVFSVGAGTPGGAISTVVPGVTASFNPAIAGEGTHLVIYTIGDPVTGCQVIDTVEIHVQAASDPIFEAGGPYCVDETTVNIALINPDPSVQEGSPDNNQEVSWNASCGACLTVNPDSTTAVFNPSAAGPGYHLICVATGDASCIRYFCDLVYVAPSLDATLASDISRGCFDLRFSLSCGTGVVDFDLSEFYTPTTTRGGTWTIVSGPGCVIVNETFIAEAGCHELMYTVPAAFPGATGDCEAMTNTVFLRIVEEPQPDFELANDVCWDGVAGSVTIPTLYNGTTFGDNATRSFAWTATLLSGAGPVPTFSSTSVQEPTLTIQGAGTFSICVTETLSYPVCGPLDPESCSRTHCEQLVVHQTTVVAIPTWSPPGPFCIDQGCVDLDVLVVGTPNGVFTGAGVGTDPTHPNYEFCPVNAGPGTHVVCYTVNNGAGCTATECHNIVVYDAVDVSCADFQDTLQCATKPLGMSNNTYGPFGGTTLTSRYTLGTHDLNSMLCASASRGGFWTFISGPGVNRGAVAGHLLYFTDPGCYVVRYTVQSAPGLLGACLATQDFVVHVGERPKPSFDLPSSICWDQVSTVTLTIPNDLITSPTYTGTVTRTYRSTNTSVVTVTPTTGVITVVGNGTAQICMEEVVTTAACGPFITAPARCTAEVCRVIRIINNTTVVNPSWNDPGPICIDQPCIDLDALVTGTPNGIFTGRGVQTDPSHPNYCFDPAVAGAGIHAVTYTVNSPDGCTGVMTRNIQVFPAVSATIAADRARGCYVFNKSAGGPFIDFNLEELLLATTTRGGVWSYIGGPGGTIRNYTLSALPGCHTLRYSVGPSGPGLGGACGAMTDDIMLLLIEAPEPDFDLAEEVCWNGIAGSIVLQTYYNGENSGVGTSSVSYSWTVTQITGPGPVPTFSSTAVREPTVTINGAGTFELCMTETNNYAACGTVGPTSCSETHCERLVVHRTDVEVDPSWTPIGPLCVDNACVDLDIRLLGTATQGGVFTGAGVQLDPSHPNYRFCPAVAGPGIHTICYTAQNAAGCTAVECHNVQVFAAVSLSCADNRDTLQCATKALGMSNNTYGPFGGTTLTSRYTLGTHSLNALLCASATRGGSWSYLSGPTATAGAVANDLLYFTDPGCYDVRYTVSSFTGAGGACLATQDFQVYVGEQPMPMFDLPDAVCWDQVSTVSFNIPVNYLTSPTYTGTVTRRFRTTNPAVATVSAAGIVTVVGNGVASICMEEIVTTVACAGVTTRCTSEVCEVLRVENTQTIAVPSWNDPGPICIDQPCIDLDALVTGTPNGIFTGRGVQTDPSHPNYCFNPAVAGVGIHAVTYTVNSPDGCTGVMTRNIQVFPAVSATIAADRARGCYVFNKSAGGPFIDFNLEELLLATTTRGGVWSYIGGPGGTIRNYTLSALPGCHTLRYSVGPSGPGLGGACGAMTDDIMLLLTEAPEPDFDLAEEVCWNGIAGSIVLQTYYNGENSGVGTSSVSYSWTVTQITGPGPVPTFSSTAVREPTVTINGAGTFELCMTETNNYAACGTVGPTSCSETHCERLVVHRTDVEVDPSWTPFGPLCVDNACVDLDARLLGTSTAGGVFQGVGVELDPSHPNYRFCPAVAGPGIHTICYTAQNASGCTAVECHNVQVFAAVSLSCADNRDTLQCATKVKGPNSNNYGPFGGVLLSSRYTLNTYSLNALLCPTATLGGTWSFVSGPSAGTGAVYDGLLYFTSPGCYTVRYTVSAFAGAMGACTATQDFQIHVGEMPMPMFDLPDHVCWDQVNVVQYNIPSSFLTSPSYTGTVARSYRSTNTSVATVSAAGVVTIVGNGTATICMEETITSSSCGVVTTCRAEFCEVIRVVNNSTVVNPVWTAIGPFCVDNPCVRLDLLVTGTTGGVFTGQGVRPPGGTLVHPQYEFCPAIAGPGIHAITYTVNSPDGCTGSFTRNVVVHPAVNASLNNDSIVCQIEPAGLVDLTALFTPLTTGGGTFTLTSGPASGRVVGGSHLNYVEAGCYCFNYTVSAFPGATGACLATGSACLLITEQPRPNFDVQNERCWNITDPVALRRDTIRVNSPSYDPAGTLSRTLRVLSGPAIVIANGPSIFAVEYTGTGNVVLCLEETLTYGACGTIPAGRLCRDTICRQVSVQDGTAQDARFTVIGAKAEYCPGDTITLIPNVQGGIFTGTNVGNSNPPGTSGGIRFTGCGIYVATYTLETPAGCINQFSQTFFTDRTNPVFTGPTAANRFDTVVNCDGLDQTARMNAWASRFTFTDNCQFRVFNRVYDRRSGCSPSTGLYVFEVTGRDTCGNETKIYPTYRIQDTTRPSFTTLPSNLVVECGNETDAQIIAWLNANGNAVATDICSGNRLRWTHNFSGDIANYCTATGTAVTFTVFDECNNSNNATALIIVRDQEPPIWNVRPQNLTLECDGTSDPLNAINAWLQSNGNGVALDSCQLTVRYSHNFTRLTGGCNRNTGSALVTFTASDACNNSVTAQATVRVRDTVPPEIISPAKDTVIYCSIANGSPANITAARTAWLNAMGRSVSIDRCDGRTRNAAITTGPDQTISTLMRTIPGCAAPLVTETWMFQYRDSCGNISAATIADFIVRDTTAPVWAVNPQNLVVECDRNGNPPDLAAWLANNGGGSLLVDACNGTTRIEHNLVRHYDKCSNTDSMVYRFTAFDCSGNSSTREASFFIRDITPPVIDPASGYNKITSCDDSNRGNDDEIIAWLDSIGGLRATDMCSDVINWRHNFSDTRWIRGCGDTRFQDVTFTATDDCGNFSTRTLRIGTVDTTRPLFLNCPRPPIVVAAETFHCDAYVNFSPIAATDNCSGVRITQIDRTGLSSGKRFPVGTTMLVWEARDSCGNVDTCKLKIIVNDYWDVPTIACPAPITVNTALDSCGVSVLAPSLAPSRVTDNCPNTIVTYQIKDSTGKVIKVGFTNATGSFFPVGLNTIEYCVYDQPLLLISEVTQMLGGALTVGRTNPVPGFITSNVAPVELIDGDYLEITNYGPSVIDLTCLSIEVVDAAGTVCNYTIPPTFPLMPQHFLAPGRVAVFHVGPGTDSPANLFFNMNCSQVGPNVGRGYLIKLHDRIIDVVATNGFNPVGRGTPTPVTLNDWQGALPPHVCRGSYYRISHVDVNRSTDFDLANSCTPATIGSLNRDHKFVPSNGDTVSLQSTMANFACCSTTVRVNDVQSPECARYDTLTFANPTNLNVAFAQGTCFRSVINVPQNCLVGDFRILDLRGSTSENLGDWKVTLISPSGTRILLWENICPAATSFNLNISELGAKGTANSAISAAPCVPNFGNGGFFKAAETMNSVYHERSNGNWILEIEDNSCASASITNILNSWRLQILCIAPPVLRDTVITADFRQCRRKFVWFHPVFNDNCKNGRIDLSFEAVTTTTACGTRITPAFIPPNKNNVNGGACDSVILALGTTKFKYLLTDRYGNTGMCMFSVTVRDVNAPVVTAIKDITITADDGECGKYYYFNIDATDSCGVDSIWSVPPSGTFFNFGTTRVCVYARDIFCNRDSSCFNVTVNPHIPSSNELVCNDQVNLSLDASCRAVITADMILEGGNHYCYDQYIITIKDLFGVPHANLFTYADVGKCFIVTITDPRSGNSCWGRVCVEDKQKPDIACPRDTVVSCLSTLDPADLGTAVLLTCEQSYTLEYFDEFFEYGECAQPYVAEVHREWILTDETGNADTCVQRIFIRRFDLADVRFPRDYDYVTPPHLECQDKRYNKDVTPHILPFPYCVDGYLLDSALWLATGGYHPSPDGDLAGVRRPKTLGWNFLETGPYAGHPSPYPIYYDPHPQWPTNRACWGPNQVVKWHGTGFPTIHGIDLVQRGRCAISMKYVDDVYEICENGYEILREWSVRNMCLPVIAGVNPLKHIQVIKVLDSRGPTVLYPDTLVLSTDAHACTGTWVVTPPWITDNCSDSVYYIVRSRVGTTVSYPNGTWAVFNIPVGTHRMEIIAKDLCGNQTVKRFVLTVVDGTPPTAVCEQSTTVNLTGNQSPGDNGGKIFAYTFDDGSHDNCSKHVFFKVIRMDELLGTNNGSTRDNPGACNGVNGDDDPALPGRQIYFDDFVKFCCDDEPSPKMVVFRVFDVDPGPGPVLPRRMNPGGNLFNRFNDCMVEVIVQNKNVPTVVAPPDIVVSCWFWFDIDKINDPNDPTFGRVVTDLSDRQKVKTHDIVCYNYCVRNDITGYPGFNPNAPPSNPPAPNRACNYYRQLFDTAHAEDKYELVWGFDGYVLSTCGNTPTITHQDLRECGQGRITRTVVARGPNNVVVRATQTIWVVDCDPFYVSNQRCDDLDDIVWPDCSGIGTSIAGCGADISPDNPLLGRPRVVNGADDNCALISIEYFDEIFTIEPDACFKVLRKWVVIDWCQYDPNLHPTRGRWEHLQLIKVFDTDKPVVNCVVGPCEPAVKNPVDKICYGHISLSATATDNCTPETWLSYEYKIDAFNDGRGQHSGYDFIVGTLTRKQYAAGEQVTKSHNPYADDPLNPFDASGTYPVGVHRICWFVEDGCGNVGICCSLFEIKDCKAPTPYCLTGIVTVPMPATKCVDIWAKDLDSGSFDNCTDQKDLKFYFDGSASKTSIRICCEDFVNAGANDLLLVPVQVWVEDLEGNKDYCRTTVVVQDNQDLCLNSGSTGKIVGEIRTTKSEMTEQAMVEISGPSVLVPQMMTKNDGKYFFGELKTGNSFNIKPSRTDNPLNGVSTADIVRIQRHILAVDLITDPYQLIAADVNNSQQITTADMSEIRRLILGVVSEFSKVQSWTFVPADYVFNPSERAYPFNAPRDKTVAVNLPITYQQDFISIKMGDVTGNAKASSASGVITRSAGQFTLEIEEAELEIGKSYTVEFKSSDFVNISGYQFTLKFDQTALMFESLQPGVLAISDANFGLNRLSEGLITTSWHSNKAQTHERDEVLFTLTFTATKSGKLSECMAITSDVTIAEAYTEDLQLLDVGLAVRRGDVLTETGVFDLHQNIPNPFDKETVITYRLPKASPARISIYDETGKVVRIIELEGAKGLNNLKLNRLDINSTSGVLYYQLDAANHTATKRMVLTH